MNREDAPAIEGKEAERPVNKGVETDPAQIERIASHVRAILVELGRLVWLRAIYGVDLATYAYDPGYTTDLKALADAILDDADLTGAAFSEGEPLA